MKFYARQLNLAELVVEIYVTFEGVTRSQNDSFEWEQSVKKEVFRQTYWILKQKALIL